MTGFERRWIVSTLSGFAAGHPVLAAREIDWVSAYRTMSGSSTRLAAFGLRLALWMASLAPIWRFERLRTMVGLSAERRGALLDQLLAHRFRVVRELTTLLKLVATMAIFARPEPRAFVGHVERVSDAISASGERPKPMLGNVVQLRPRRNREQEAS